MRETHWMRLHDKSNPDLYNDFLEVEKVYSGTRVYVGPRGRDLILDDDQVKTLITTLQNMLWEKGAKNV